MSLRAYIQEVFPGNRLSKLTAQAFLVVGSLIIVGTFLGDPFAGDTSGWRETEATVIKNEAHSSDPIVYVPVVVYEFEGEQYSGTGRVAREDEYKAGDTLPIVGNPNNPNDFAPKAGMKWWAIALCAIAGAYLLFIFSSAIRHVAPHGHKKKNPIKR